MCVCVCVCVFPVVGVSVWVYGSVWLLGAIDVCCFECVWYDVCACVIRGVRALCIFYTFFRNLHEVELLLLEGVGS